MLSCAVWVGFQTLSFHQCVKLLCLSHIGLHWWIKQTAVTWQSLCNCWYVILEGCFLFRMNINKGPCRPVHKPCWSQLQVMVATVQMRSQLTGWEKYDLYVVRLFSQNLTFKGSQLCRRDVHDHTTRTVKGIKETHLRMRSPVPTVSVFCSRWNICSIS